MRQPTHDYAAAGAYFVTICAHQRQLVFEDPTVSDVIAWAWHQIPDHFPDTELDAFVVMPNHVHGIMMIRERSGSSMVGAQHVARLPSNTVPGIPGSQPTLSVIIRTFKAAVTRELRIRNLWDERPFWQPNFYDRVVRDEHELERIRAYIAQNPARWRFDEENPGRVSDPAHQDRWAWLESTVDH